MNELLANPAIQSGVAPFSVGLVVSAVLARTRLLGLAQIAGFVTLAVLAIGLSFEALTSLKKLVLVGVGTAFGVVVLEGRFSMRRAVQWFVLAMLAIGTVWTLSRLLAQKDTAEMLLRGVLSAAFVVMLAGTTLRVGADPVRGAAAGLMMGLGMGALAVLGASAVLGLVAISVGASAGATLLIQMVRGKAAEPGASISLPASAIVGLTGVLAVHTASLPWYSLLPVLAAPLATLAVPLTVAPVWLRACFAAAAALVPMGIAVALAWLLPSGS